MRVNTNTRGTRKGTDGTKLQQLRRSVMANLLWENEFYEDGVSIAQRIQTLAGEVTPEQLAEVAVEARDKHNLRHVPLLLTTQLVKHGAGKQGLVADTIFKVVQRADELAELVSLYWKGGKKPLSAQLKKGLAKAFTKFNAYSLAKYNRDTEVKLRDVLFLVHAKGKDAEQQAVFDQLAAGTLAAPDTWEVALSGGANKKETWERLLKEGKLGYMALLRNLRNMQQAGVDRTLVRDAILARKGADKVLPFRFVAAAKAAPTYENDLDTAMLAHLAQMPKLKGKTVVIVDTSGSMHAQLSGKSDMNRMQAAGTVAAILREICEEPVIYATAGDDWQRKHATMEVPARRGMALVDAVGSLQSKIGGGGIFLTQVMDFILAKEKTADRVIVFTDEADCDTRPEGAPSKAKKFDGANHYIVNVGSYKNGVGYNNGWNHVTGFSENVIRWIYESEQQ